MEHRSIEYRLRILIYLLKSTYILIQGPCELACLKQVISAALMLSCRRQAGTLNKYLPYALHLFFVAVAYLVKDGHNELAEITLGP